MARVVHASAAVDAGASLGDDVEVGPYAVVEAGASIGAHTRILAHAVVRSGSVLGERCEVHPGAVIGGEPQDRHFAGESSRVVIGDDTIIREAATVNRGTGEGTETRVGDRCMLMACSHVAHNCTVGNDVVLVNSALLAGHVEVHNGAFLSGNTSVHQFCRIGRLAMLGGHSSISLDLPPFMTATGMRGNEVSGLNAVGLRRAGVEPAARAALKEAFRLLYRSNDPLEEVLAALERSGCPEVLELVAFCRTSKRGVIRLYGNPHR